MHHLLLELYSLDDVGQGHDLARAQGDRVKVSLGRHNNDYMTSFYLQTPSNFLIEYGWGGRQVDVARWQPIEISTLASFWGHEGLRQSIRGDASRPMHVPPEARRAPLQVMEGNYERLSGVCPWWDAMTANLEFIKLHCHGHNALNRNRRLSRAYRGVHHRAHSRDPLARPATHAKILSELLELR